jgi:hypothetical protein
MFSWNFKKAMTVNFKVSIGYCDPNSYKYIGNYFANITLGLRGVTERNEFLKDYYYAELEGGTFTGPGPLISGLGLGIAFLKGPEKSIDLAPKA